MILNKSQKHFAVGVHFCHLELVWEKIKSKFLIKSTTNKLLHDADGP